MNNRSFTPLLSLLISGFVFSGSFPMNCSGSTCAEKLTVGNVGQHDITVQWHHECYTCDTWEVCYKKAGVFNGWVCIPYAAAGSERGNTYTISGLESGMTYLIEVKNAMGDGCQLKTLGSVKQATH